MRGMTVERLACGSGSRRWLRTPKPRRPWLCLSVGFEGQGGRSPHREVGQPSAPVSKLVESRAEDVSGLSGTVSVRDETGEFTGSDVLGSAESAARRFPRAAAPGRRATGPSRRAHGSSGRVCVSPISFAGLEAGSRLRGVGGESLERHTCRGSAVGPGRPGLA